MTRHQLPHIILHGTTAREPYRPHPPAIKSPPIPPRDRATWAARLSSELKNAMDDAQQRRTTTAIRVQGVTPGIYVEFEQATDSPPIELEKLESRSKGIELVSVSGEEGPQRARVFIPDGSVSYFFKKFEAYAGKESASGKPKNQKLVESIGAIRLATLRALWTDNPGQYPVDSEAIWWEVWLRRHDGQEEERFTAFAKQARVRLGERTLSFVDRLIVLAFATPEALSASLDVLNDIAELRRARELPSTFADMTTQEQVEWSHELRSRTTAPSPRAPAVCVLDTGVNRAHPLLEIALLAQDQHTCHASFGVHDGHPQGHGTAMAGLALYGDLTETLASSEPIVLEHRLESVKILPDRGKNAPDLYGRVMLDAASHTEIQAPSRPRVYSMAVSAEDSGDVGQPTAWSAAVDALAVGVLFETDRKGIAYLDDGTAPTPRLMVVSAGNLRGELPIQYLDACDLASIEDPGQAWNALTVGAYTERIHLDPSDRELTGWEPLALPGELSPYSRTSYTWESQWPLKPDIVMEGGNVARSPGGHHVLQVDSLSLLTTYHRPLQRLFTTTWATSAATAQASRAAALIMARHPSLWPETVRALLVHSAGWTPQMMKGFRKAPSRTARGLLVRRYGFGVPNLERALFSASNALTLIVEEHQRPFVLGASSITLNELHIHRLPWPREVLQELGAATVRMRVTLSYFIEPNPARRGWKKHHQYASHNLLFEVKPPLLSLDQFRKRLNQKALGEEESRPESGRDSKEWFLGPELRRKGSLHSDIWEGSAADLAEKGYIAVYPATGWWKDKPGTKRYERSVRYALVISIETPDVDADIYTPVAQQVGITIEG